MFAKGFSGCVVVAALLLSAVEPANTMGLFCTRPAAPSCPMMGRFDSDWEFNSCKSEMDSYQNSVERYFDCLNDEKSATIREYNEAVERFNCYARGGSIC